MISGIPGNLESVRRFFEIPAPRRENDVKKLCAKMTSLVSRDSRTASENDGEKGMCENDGKKEDARE